MKAKTRLAVAAANTTTHIAALFHLPKSNNAGVEYPIFASNHRLDSKQAADFSAA